MFHTNRMLQAFLSPSRWFHRPSLLVGPSWLQVEPYLNIHMYIYYITYIHIHLSIIFPLFIHGISIISVRLEHMINRHVFCYTHSYFLRLWNWLQTSLPWFLRCGSLPCWQHRSIDARSSVGLHCSRVEAVVELFCLFQYVSLLSMEVVEKS